MHGPSAVVGSKGSKKLKDAKANKRLAKAEERKSKRLQREMAVSVRSDFVWRSLVVCVLPHSSTVQLFFLYRTNRAVD